MPVIIPHAENGIEDLFSRIFKDPGAQAGILRFRLGKFTNNFLVTGTQKTEKLRTTPMETWAQVELMGKASP